MTPPTLALVRSSEPGAAVFEPFDRDAVRCIVEALIERAATVSETDALLVRATLRRCREAL